MSTSTTNITLRVDLALLDRINQAASLHGQNRTEYILSWLPILYDSKPQTTADKAEQGQRVVRSRAQSSPTRT